MSTQSKTAIDEILAQIDKEVHPDLYNLIEKNFEEIIEKNESPKDFLGLTDKFVEFGYSQAYNLFKAGKYQKASKLFLLLCQLDPLDPRFMFSNAACYHYMKDYSTAAGNYLFAKDLDPKNPIIGFHLFDCYKHLGVDKLALFFLNDCINLCEGFKYKELKQRALLEKKGFINNNNLIYY